MDFTNEINTLESEKLRLEEMLKRNNDRLQLLKEVSTKPSSDGYRRFFKLKGMAKGRMYCAEIGIFEIPVGATVYINYAHREVVSTDIKYLGLLEE